VCTELYRSGIIRWKTGVWRLQGVRGNTEQGTCPICGEEEGWSHTLRCEGRKICRDDIPGKRFRNIEAEIGVRKMVRISSNVRT
jgi:hypothetical protein